MGKRIWKRALALTFCLMLLCSSFSALAADEKIERSTKNYTVIIQDADKVFIGNKKSVDWEVGDKYFLTYTVDSVTENSVIQSGLVCTDTPDTHYPHDSGSGIGGLQYTQKNVLCEEGYTYFLRFEVTENGMTYIAAKAKGGESEYISDFIHQWPVPEVKNTTWQKMTGTTKVTNFGAWFAEGGKVNAKLTHVRCYDEDGNDLGVYGNKTLGVFAIDESSMTPKEGINHTYNFSLKDAAMIYFGSARETTSQTIFLEYTVKNVKAKDMTQSGVVMTKDTSINYPHTVEYGYLNYQQHTDETGPVQLVTEGATYFVRIDRTDKAFEVLVKRTLANGKVDYFSYPHFFGTESNEWPMAGMWIGENCSVTADFINCKAYDAEGNNLAITTNQKDVVVEHIGDLEDYSKCEAVYYCKENNTFISLDDECNASRRVDGEDVSKMGKYSIRKTTLSLSIGEETEEFEYLYTAMIDKDENRYVRLSEYDVVFHTRFMGGEVVETVTASAANGFKVEKPGEPKEEGRTFKFWKTAANEEFDFDSVVTEATHLYASWEGEDTWEAVAAAVVRKDPAAMIVIAVSVILVIGTVVGVVMIGRGKKNGKKQKEK